MVALHALSAELSCRHRTERGQGAESRPMRLRAFPAHILSPGLKWVRGESPRPLRPWTSAGVWSRAGFTHGAQGPGMARQGIQVLRPGVPSRGSHLLGGAGRCRLGLRPRGAGLGLKGAQGLGNGDRDVSRVLLAQHIENRALQRIQELILCPGSLCHKPCIGTSGIWEIHKLRSIPYLLHILASQTSPPIPQDWGLGSPPQDPFFTKTHLHPPLRSGVPSAPPSIPAQDTCTPSVDTPPQMC